MKKLHARKGGFTLIELMIVVAIIGILAAIAIPNFLRFQLKAKSSEGKTNLAAIRTAEQSYYSEFGVYVSADVSPAAPPAAGRSRSCPRHEQRLAGTPGFDDARLVARGQRVLQLRGRHGRRRHDFFATANADIDANATPHRSWAIARPRRVGPADARRHACAMTGQPATRSCPATAAMGQSVF